MHEGKQKRECESVLKTSHSIKILEKGSKAEVLDNVFPRFFWGEENVKCFISDFQPTFLFLAGDHGGLQQELHDNLCCIQKHFSDLGFGRVPV